MHDQWTNYERKPENDRVTRLFRRHVRSPSSPKGEIVRQPCQFHPDRPDAEFHHVDYSRPFYGAWLCHQCHRKADHDGIDEERLALVDYSNVVRLHPERMRNDRTAMPYNFPPKTGTDDAPF